MTGSGAKRPFIAKGASGLATGKECAKPYQLESGFPLIGHCAEANAVRAQYLALNRARE